MISTSSCRIGSIIYKSFLNYSTARESRMLKNLIKSNQNNDYRKPSKYNRVAYGHLKTLVVEEKPHSSSKKKKINVLNKAYENHISEALLSSKTGVKLFDLGVHISKVNIFDKSGKLDIYWFGDSIKVGEEDVDKILTEAALELKQELGLYNKIGRPFHVRFVRDMVRENTIIVENIIQNPEFKKDLEIADDSCNMDLNIAAEMDNVSPQMKHDVYNLNHEEYQEKILKEKKKNLRAEEKKIKIEDISEGPFIKFDKFAYEKFYRKKEALRRKKLNENESLIYNPADDMVFGEEPEVEWKYGEDGEVSIELEKQQQKYISNKKKIYDALKSNQES